MLLAIDTATQNISLALHDGGEVIFEQTWRSRNQHSVELAPAVQSVLYQIDSIENASLTALAVSIGPGTYTGLRVGVAFAKGFASARQVPLVGVTTLDILAAAQSEFDGTLIAVVQAGRGRVAAAFYQWRNGRWRIQSEPVSTDWEMLLMHIDGPALITGEIDADARERLTYAIGMGMPVTIASGASRLRRAGFLAEEALRRLYGAPEDAEEVESSPSSYEAAQVVPVYVKTKDSP